MFAISLVFLIASAAVAVLGFGSARSDIQIIIGLIGLFSGGFFLLSLLQVQAHRALLERLDKMERELRRMKG